MIAAGFLEQLLDGADVAWVPLGEVASIKTGGAVNKDMIANNPGKFPVINSGREPLGYINNWNTNDDPIGITTRGAGVGSVTWQEGKYLRGNLNYSVTDKSTYPLKTRYLYHLLLVMQKNIQSLCTYDGIPALNASKLKTLPIPIPCPHDPEKSQAIQAEIVRILDRFTEMTSELTSELAARKKQYNHCRDQLLTFKEGEVAWKALGEVFDISAGGDAPKGAISPEESEDFKIPILSNGIGKNALYGWTNTAKVQKPSLTVSARGTIGWTSYRERPFFPIVRLLVLTPKAGINLRFAYHYMKTIESGYKVPPSGIPQLTKPMIQGTPFPIPFATDPDKSHSEQTRIAKILDKFDTLTTSLSEGLPREIALRQQQYEYYRNLLLSFPKPAEPAEA